MASKDMPPKLVIVGKPTCLLCNRALTQQDADQGKVIGIGETLNHFPLFCLNHFYVLQDDKLVETSDYDQNMERLAQTLAKGLRLNTTEQDKIH